MNNTKDMIVNMKSDFTFKVGYCDEYVTFKGAFEKGIIEVITTNLTITNDDGRVLEDGPVKDNIIQAILYGLKEKG